MCSLFSPDARYIQFGEQIRGLGRTLEILKAQAADQERRSGPYLEPSTSASQEGARQDFFEAVGDYEETLRACESLLTKHKDIQKDGAGFVKNVIWGSAIQGKVDALLTRIQTHNGKIHLLLEPLRNDRMHGIENGLFGLVELLDPAPELDETRIPPQIASKFQEALKESLFRRSTTFECIQRKEKLDTLYKIWRSSTVRASQEADQTIEQHLNLLKSAWFIGQLKTDDAFHTARRGYPYRRTILELQRAIVWEYERIRLQMSEENFLRLDSTSFRILQTDLPEATVLQLDDGKRSY